MRIFTAKKQDTGKRADVFVAEHYPAYARSALLKLFGANLIEINEKPAKAGYKLRAKDKILVDETILKKNLDTINLPIIYEDDNVIVIDKPVGILSHSKGGLDNEPSVASFIREKVVLDNAETNVRAGIVHRLDRATSGVMICAKNSQTLAYLQKQFSSRRTQKRYIAVIEGELKEPTAIIEAPIKRNPKRPTTFMVHGSGKSAVTKYKTIQSDNGFSLIELEPLTGRTHQLRVHMSYLNHPIVGDWLYGGQPAGRLLLHAAELSIRLPNSDLKTFESSMPNEFDKYFKKPQT